ncbi:MAG: hypothetical protein ACHQF3_01895 [Alphaproteobacteria bacterium]
MEAALLRHLAAAAVIAALLAAAAPAEAQLLGLERYLSPPKVDYAAEVVMTADGTAVAGKIMRAAGRERREVTVDGELEIVIIRLDRKLVWSLAPDDKLYVESSLDDVLGRVPDASGKAREPQLNVTSLGSEPVAGVAATKKKVSGKEPDGSPIEGVVWVSDDGIVLRAESVLIDEDGKHHSMRMELKNVHVGSQSPALFEIPAGYKRVTRGKTGSLTPPPGIGARRG